MKRIVILGSTGSIGRQALEVAAWFPDRLKVVGLAVHRNIDLLEKQARYFGDAKVAVTDREAALLFNQRVGKLGRSCLAGPEGMLELARLSEADSILVAISGIAGLKPTLTALYHGKEVALANKETMVAGGELVVKAARSHRGKIIPVDSEHSAIFQCLERLEEVDRLILTGSGGPFRNFTGEQLEQVTPAMALRHPNWSMGAKITVDSATLMNKGLEVIEAHWLFGIDYKRIQVIIHPQSIIHSLVAYRDGVVLGQMGVPDMRIPIQYALFYPERRKNQLQQLDLIQVGRLTFEEPRSDLFPALELARRAGEMGGTMPAVLNAANEVAVAAFLKGKIPFTAIAGIVSQVMEQFGSEKIKDLEQVLEADYQARELAGQLITLR